MQTVVNEHDESVDEENGSAIEHKCSYTECQIDNSCHHQIFQIIYLAVSILILTNGPDQFTSFAIFLFASPVLVDLIFFKPTCQINYNAKFILIIISGLYTLMYFLCAGNVIIEYPECFIVNKSNFLIGWLSVKPFSKRFLSIMLIPLIIAPALGWIGVADKNISTISDVFRSFKRDKKT